MKTQSTVAVLESPIHIRPMGKLEKLFKYGANDTVTLEKDSKLTAPELVAFLSERLQKWGSETVRIANTLRLARMLPAVKEGDKEVEAFKWAVDKLKSNSATASTFTNIVYLIPAIDVIEQNGLNVSPFAAKNALGWLKDKKVIDEKTGKFLPSAVADPVAAKLKAGIGASQLAKDLREMRRPAQTSTPPAGGTVEDSGTKVAFDILSLVGRVTKLHEAGKVEETRKAIAGAVKDLAKLAGFDCVPIK